MATSSRQSSVLSRLKALLTLQRFKHTLAETATKAKVFADMESHTVLEHGQIDTSTWRKLDARTLGITRSMISSPSWIVLKVLQNAGFEAYLVGGCVRDLLLNKVPKDFDVITSAALKQIKEEFHRCEIVGRRFPICMVHIRSSVVEVSSFETVAEHDREKEVVLSEMPRGCDRKDIVRWRNCMHRDFTINSLFFDPFVNKIYDYANGMMDLKSLKLRTLIPAQLSFEEDCARILRGLRIAARLGLSFSKETEFAIHKLSLSITSLAKSRIMMEVNYMLSYGAAEPSLCLLQRFNLLQILLPFHAAYLAQQAGNQSHRSSLMLMKLFFNLDKLVTCDHPSDCSLWVGLLAFHMALVNNPQDALVVWTFASVLYHENWKEGVAFAREHAQATAMFIPEISEAHNFISDDELADKVTQLASVVQDSIGALTVTDSLLQSMSRFPDSPCPGLVFISRKAAKDAANLFRVLVHDVESYKKGRKSFSIESNLLGKGDLRETRFVIGKIIMDTMSSGAVQGSKDVEEGKGHLHTLDPEYDEVDVSAENCDLVTFDIKMQHGLGEEDKKRCASPFSTELLQERAKKQRLIGKECKLSEDGRIKKQKAVAKTEIKKIAEQKHKMGENSKTPEARKLVKKEAETMKNEITKEQQDSCNLPLEELISSQANVPENVTEDKQKIVVNGKFQKRFQKRLNVVKGKKYEPQEKVNKAPLNLVEKRHSPQNRSHQQEGVLEEKNRLIHQNKETTVKNEKHKRDVTKEKPNGRFLSSLFR